jgi:hypothetical protein
MKVALLDLETARYPTIRGETERAAECLLTDPASRERLARPIDAEISDVRPDRVVDTLAAIDRKR